MNVTGFYSENNIQYKYKQTLGITKQQKNLCYRSVGNENLPKISSVYFKGINQVKKSTFFPSTFSRIDKLYDRYKNNLMEVSIDEIKTISEKLQVELNLPKEEVLSAMAEITQFSSMKAIPEIGEILNKHKIGSIGNTHNLLSNKLRKSDNLYQNYNVQNTLTNDRGLHKTLNYLLYSKGMFMLNEYDNDKIGIILDKSKLSYYEELKKKNPELLERVLKLTNLRYFIISGWDTGIPVVDRTKDLETETRNLLVKSINAGKKSSEILDLDLIERANNIGFKKVTLIKRTVNPTEEGVYNNMAPTQMSKEELRNILEANSQVRTKTLQNAQINNDISTKYLEKELVVYSPEKISKNLKSMHEKILKYAKLRKIKEDDILYVTPEESKSYDLITYSYQMINNIPDKNITSTDNLILNRNDKNKILVFLDDCTITGASTTEIISSYIDRQTLKNSDCILFAFIEGTKQAKEYYYKICKDKPKFKLLVFNSEPSNNFISNNKRILKRAIGTSSFDNSFYAYVFPYMSPDNNCELASNIALLHNVNYRRNEKYLNRVLYRAIKTSSKEVEDVMEQFEKISQK